MELQLRYVSQCNEVYQFGFDVVVESGAFCWLRICVRFGDARLKCVQQELGEFKRDCSARVKIAPESSRNHRLPRFARVAIARHSNDRYWTNIE